MRVIVVYYSQTGNTKKIAQAIFQVIKTKKHLKEVKEIDSLEGYDLVFVGFPLHYGGPAKPAKNFLEKHAQGKKIALFVTHSTREDSKGLQKWLAKCKKVAQEAELVGFFNCQGNINVIRLNRASSFAKRVMKKFES
ncbi:MAG: flavodoxin family protein [candidate division WOR-3 bacterium]|nr:flavodoxin family protein [candidate division WOR-3 bacterium]